MIFRPIRRRSLPDIRRLQLQFYVCTWARTSVLTGQHGLCPWQPTIPTGHANCQSLFNQGLLPVVQFLKSPLHLFRLYAVPENVGIVPSIIKGNIFVGFLAVLVCHIERLLIADATDNFQIFFRKGKIAVVFLGKFVDRILGICLLYTSDAADEYACV